MNVKYVCYTIINMDRIEELLTRGVANIIPGKKELQKVLESGKKLNIYLGIDPTAPKIHLGHAVPLRKLKALANMGHNVTLLIGDFTTLVGDTSDKESERPILTEKEIDNNLQTYKKQAEKVFGSSEIKFRRNSEWLSGLTYKEILKLKQHFSLNDFISRELIRKRLDAGKSVRLDETEYPIMQGYDSYFMDTDLQLGATDQTFNMQAGRTLQKVLRNKESFIITNTFLDGTDGRKMSKSWGNAIWLDDTPEDMYAKVMAIKDEIIVQYFTLATDLPMSRITQIEKDLQNGIPPMPIKFLLAYTIVSEIYDKKSADYAQEQFNMRVREKGMPMDIPTISVDMDGTIIDVLVEAGLAASKSDAKRLIEQGGVEIDNDKITDGNLTFETLAKNDETVIQVGKRRYVKVKIGK